MRQTIIIFILYSFVLIVSTVFHHNDSLHVGVLDESGTEHHLIAIRNLIAVTLIPKEWENTLGSVFHWAASRWFYHGQTQKLTPLKQKELCLEGDPDSFTLHLSNCSPSTENQRFLYNQAERELFWINPITNRHHPIYLEKDCTRISQRTPFTQRRPLISKNPVSKWIADEARRFETEVLKNASAKVSRPRGYRLRALTVHSLQKVLPNMSNIEYQKYMEIIGCMNGCEFGYFLNKQNRYLLSDGHTVTPSKKYRNNATNYKYYGLWNLNDDNHLVHFLSGKYLQAIPNYASRNIQLLENMLHSKVNLSKINDTFYDLKVNEYSKGYHDTFVTVDGRGEQHDMFIHNDGKPEKIGGTITTQGADAYLAFLNKSTYDYMWRIILKDIAEKNQKGAQKVKQMKLKRVAGFSF